MRGGDWNIYGSPLRWQSEPSLIHHPEVQRIGGYGGAAMTRIAVCGGVYANPYALRRDVG